MTLRGVSWVVIAVAAMTWIGVGLSVATVMVGDDSAVEVLALPMFAAVMTTGAAVVVGRRAARAETDGA